VRGYSVLEVFKSYEASHLMWAIVTDDPVTAIQTNRRDVSVSLPYPCAQQNS